MRRTSVVLVVAAIACFATMTSAGEGTAETSVHGTVFGHWAMDLSEGADKANEFGLSRAYVTAKAKLSEKTSGRITLDYMLDGGEYYYNDEAQRWGVLVKYAHIDWMPGCFGADKLKIRFGLQPTMYIAMMNYLWGHRYVAKTAGDAAGFLPTSDMGASLFLALGEAWRFGYVGLSVLNGAGYKDVVEANKQKDINLFAKITPLQDNPKFKGTTFGGQYYKGTQNVAIAEGADAADYKSDLISAGGLLAYDGKIDIGADYNSHVYGEGAGIDATTSTAMTFFTTIYLVGLIQATQALHTLNVFASYSMNDPDTDAESTYWDNSKYKILLVGLECAPAKGVKTSFTYSTKSYDLDTEDNDDGFAFNTMIEF